MSDNLKHPVTGRPVAVMMSFLFLTHDATDSTTPSPLSRCCDPAASRAFGC